MFQHLMKKVLAGLTTCKAYIDDVIVYSTWEEHMKHLRALFECLVHLPGRSNVIADALSRA